MMTENLQTPFERGNGNQTATYPETIDYYEQLDKKFDEIKLFTHGSTDIGKPIHLCVISGDKDFDPTSLRSKGKCILMINNGIHPGEPEGIDASMAFARDLLTKEELKPLLEHVVILIIPIYNVGGALNRNSNSRANQNGPESYGFRGNAKNLDLNRDFIKCDSRNARTFTEIFRQWQPHVFLDNHTSNGADYAYVMTLIATQKDKLSPALGSYLDGQMLPALYDRMDQAGYPMIPYVDPIETIPDSGIVGFLETPRYTTGYTALFNTIGFISETHMLKPFKPRVLSTYALMVALLKVTDKDREAILEARKSADREVISRETFPITWKLDDQSFEEINFKGYQAKYKTSVISGEQRLYYDRNEPWERKIKFFNTYIPGITVKKPYAYIVPQGWTEVIDRLSWNGVRMKKLTQDVKLRVEATYFEHYETGSKPYEAHYPHRNIKTRQETQEWPYYKGDRVILTDQTANRYILETLEPEAHDSYFVWNFFDAVLQQKEWYSSYVFEDLAAEMLENDPALLTAFEARKKEDEAFAKDPRQQLYFLYKRSPYYEQKTHNRYPVTKIMDPVDLPME